MIQALKDKGKTALLAWNLMIRNDKCKGNI